MIIESRDLFLLIFVISSQIWSVFFVDVVLNRINERLQIFYWQNKLDEMAKGDKNDN